MKSFRTNYYRQDFHFAMKLKEIGKHYSNNGLESELPDPDSEFDLDSPTLQEDSEAPHVIKAEKYASEKVGIKRQLSDCTGATDGEKMIIKMKPNRTHVSTKHMDIIDLFSNNVVSERNRQDPREAEGRDSHNLEVFETVEEVDMEEDDESILGDEEGGRKDTQDYTSNKQILGHGVYNYDIKEEQKEVTEKEQPKPKKKRIREVEEVVYQEVDDIELDKIHSDDFDTSVEVSLYWSNII